MHLCSEIHTRKILLLNSYSLIPSWWANVLQKEQIFWNPHKKAVFLVHNAGSNFIDQPDTARTGNVQSTFWPLFCTHWFHKIHWVFHLEVIFFRQGCMRSKLDSSRSNWHSQCFLGLLNSDRTISWSFQTLAWICK